MSNHAARHANERTPNPFASFVLVAAVLTGGLFAGHAWAVDTCPTGTVPAVVCDLVA